MDIQDDVWCLDENLIANSIETKEEMPQINDGLVEQIVRQTKKPKEKPISMPEKNIFDVTEKDVFDVAEKDNKAEKNILNIEEEYDKPEKDVFDITEKPPVSEKSKVEVKKEKKRPRLEGDGENITISTNSFVIGYSRDCDWVINDKVVSRKHLRITINNHKYYIEDLRSTNGTFVDGRKLDPNTLTEIFNGQEITLANRRYKFWVD